MIPPTAETRWADSFWGYAWLSWYDNENENIKRIEITGEVSSIEEGFFLRYSSLEHINVAEENEYFKSIDGVLYTKDGSAVVAYPIGRAETEYIIPEQCVAIYSYAFAEFN